MPLITLGTAEIMAIIAAEEAAAATAAIAAEAAAEAAVNEAAAQEVAKQTAAEAAKQAAAESAKQGIMQAGAGADVNAGLSQGITGATPATNVAAEGSNLAAEKLQQDVARQGLDQVGRTSGPVDFANAKPIEPFKPLPDYGLGSQYASANGSTPIINAPSGSTTVDPFGGFPSSGPDLNASMNSFNEISQIPNTPTQPGYYNADAIGNSFNEIPSNINPVEPPSPFMNAFSEAGKFAKANPFITGAGIYGTLAATGSLNQKGAAPPEQRKFNNPYTFSKDFRGTYPNPNDYQYTPRYPSYAMGGIAGIHPQTNFANPSQSMMGTSQYDMPTDPMSGNIAQRMADGGVTGSGQMQLNVPLSVGGGGGDGGIGGGGGYGGYGGYDGTGGPGLGPGVNNFGGGGGYAPPGGPKAGVTYGAPPMQERPPGFQIGQKLLQQEQREVSPPDVGSPAYENQRMQRGIGGKGSMTGPQYASGGIASYKSGGKMDVYDASLRFADMMDNPNRYSPPDTRFQSVETFRDTNPNTSTKSPEEAAEIRRKAIEQRSYVNTGAKYLPPSRRPGQLDLGPVGGERGKYDNQESVLAAQGGIMGYNLGGYASGGNPRLLRGPGDGMSDNIPATIADRQPARLADGEFVIPADVVSHLGNGSTEAGAKKLHEMMNSVRKARTGNPKQGKKINPSKFMPKK